MSNLAVVFKLLTAKKPPSMKLAVTALLLLAVAPQRASAYLDPGAGAFIWQIAAAAVVGTLFYIRRILRWFRSHLTSVFDHEDTGNLSAKQQVK